MSNGRFAGLDVLRGRFGGGGVNWCGLETNDDAVGLSRRTLEMDDPSENAREKSGIAVDA